MYGVLPYRPEDVAATSVYLRGFPKLGLHGIDVEGTRRLNSRSDFQISAAHLIGANKENGVHLENAVGTMLLANRIGTNAAGTDKLANGGDGVLLEGSSN